ncbi:coiled-coil domain-containing protein [Marimonas lutisalis]|uniref:hypothetical protein n=1 Tax=Marimonas lutisalis TaxID=2545756 RepID=UPI0010FA1C02|nr:hypothetical protein [Marimonas lutisalis]
MKKPLSRTLATLALAATLAGPAGAQQGELASAGLTQRIETLSADPAANGFELGAMMVLRAVEKSLQTRYDYGLGDRMVNLPLLRLNMGPMRNPNPREKTPDLVASMIATFVEDMAEAQKVLARAERDGVQPFELTLQDIWFDMDGDGTRSEAESAMKLLAPVILDRRVRREMEKSGALEQPLTIRFDVADQSWLAAYTHLLAGVGNAILAFDPTPVIANLDAQLAAVKDAPRIPNYWDQDAVKAEIETLKAEQERIKARSQELREMQKPFDDRIRALRDEMRKPENKPREKRDALNAQIKDIREAMRPLTDERSDLGRQSRLARNELRAAESKLAQTEEETTGPSLDDLRRMSKQLLDERRSLQAERDSLSARKQETADQRQAATTDAQRKALDAELEKLTAALSQNMDAIGENMKKSRDMRRDMTRAQLDARRGFDRRSMVRDQVRPAIDIAYLVLESLAQKPDRARLQAAQSNWLNMIAHNRIFWRELARETDNDREWIPNPDQQSALGIEVPARMAEAWQKILSDAEAVLEGRLLLPHPLMPDGTGISLAAYFADPGPIDLIEWIHGIGAYPYAARGSQITAQSWSQFSRFTHGRAGTFALFFN